MIPKLRIADDGIVELGNVLGSGGDGRFRGGRESSDEVGDVRLVLTPCSSESQVNVNLAVGHVGDWLSRGGRVARSGLEWKREGPTRRDKVKSEQ